MKHIVEKTSIRALSLFFSIVPLTLLIAWALLANIFFEGKIPKYYSYSAIIVYGMLTGLFGLCEVIKKEAPGIMGTTIKGVRAIISGVLYMTFFWGLSVIALILVILGH